jgi:hypothetical protein
MPEDGAGIVDWRPPEASPPSPWKRVGLISAVAWMVLGLLGAWLSAQAGAPRLSGWIAILTGPIALVVVGRYYRVQGPRAWAGAGCIALALALTILLGGILVLTLATYG